MSHCESKFDCSSSKCLKCTERNTRTWQPCNMGPFTAAEMQTTTDKYNRRDFKKMLCDIWKNYNVYTRQSSKVQTEMSGTMCRRVSERRANT